ncbi:hypothetical protein IDJ75_04950 [Mucilaginibacter rigui]|uniref:Universal stress protein n=1 Tax=Mucilaginibacter rigui TaxID=534635 RepID=A0ABR7X211_9SPHI|nr:hypothetical protein [Mucilaginibacter rigui]MBD1384618.1 hypothetical protein [Mucilaginibacter rigui]
MKKILMLTGFSENADHAAQTVAKVAPQLNTDILLYHTYYDHPILPTYAGGPLVVEEFAFRKEESTAKLSHHRDDFFSGLFDRSTTAAALDNQHLPLMIIPSEQTYAR